MRQSALSRATSGYLFQPGVTGWAWWPYRRQACTRPQVTQIPWERARPRSRQLSAWHRLRRCSRPRPLPQACAASAANLVQSLGDSISVWQLSMGRIPARCSPWPSQHRRP
ncbi:hypothetical protein C6A77_14440 [Pseudomonas sp. AFG_SD02_1510_Pfu_092]|nr:hypothetical protein C6A77_14440 [Pseudomonas sp. AFG_SD02_1510_Pfu_092]